MNKQPGDGLTYGQRLRLSRIDLIPDTRTAVLSTPEKMPGLAFGLPAGEACPYAVTQNNQVTGAKSICGSCYAGRGNYATAIVQNAQANRFSWVRTCMKTEAGRDEFVSEMTRIIAGIVAKTGDPYFRIHDSGDFFSPIYVRCWMRIVDALPEVNFWAPTRSWQAPWLATLVELAQRPNISVRPSALYFGDPPPVIPGLDAGTTAGKTGVNCPSHSQGNKCQDCRRCWTKTEEVTYPSH